MHAPPYAEDHLSGFMLEPQGSCPQKACWLPMVVSPGEIEATGLPPTSVGINSLSNVSGHTRGLDLFLLQSYCNPPSPGRLHLPNNPARTTRRARPRRPRGAPRRPRWWVRASRKVSDVPRSASCLCSTISSLPPTRTTVLSGARLRGSAWWHGGCGLHRSSPRARS